MFSGATIVSRKLHCRVPILSTKYSEVAELVRKLQQLAINGKPHPVRAYVATGEEALRGVVHGIQPNTSMETLMTHLRIRTQGVELVQARMIGNTKSAALTFYGDKLPRTVYFYGGELICHPFRATLQVCKVCREKGHRADVCPQPDKPIGRLCGTRNPTTGHPCQLICASCGEAHLTGDPACSKRLKPVQLRNRSSERSEKQLPSQASEVPPRWFSSEEEVEALKLGGQPARTPSKSRSRSKQRPQATKTTNQEAQQPSRATPLKKHNKQQQQGMKTPDLEVRWADVASSTAAPLTHSQAYQQVVTENKHLRAQLNSYAQKIDLLEKKIELLLEHRQADNTQPQSTQSAQAQVRQLTPTLRSSESKEPAATPHLSYEQAAQPTITHQQMQGLQQALLEQLQVSLQQQTSQQFQLLYQEFQELKRHVDETLQSALKRRRKPSTDSRCPEAKVVVTSDTEGPACSSNFPNHG